MNYLNATFCAFNTSLSATPSALEYEDSALEKYHLILDWDHYLILELDQLTLEHDYLTYVDDDEVMELKEVQERPLSLPCVRETPPGTGDQYCIPPKDRYI